MSAKEMAAPRAWLAAAGRQLPETALLRTFAGLKSGERMTLAEHWPLWPHAGQQEPEGDWRVWLLMAGRGFGKTRAGAEWLWARVRETPGARVALVAPTIDEAARVMVEGQSGLIATARADETPVWRPSRNELLLPGGGIATLYSGARPARLRGPEHHFAWCDEIAQWLHGDDAWDNLMLGLRLGERPRTVVTTTPRPGTVLGRIRAGDRVAVTRGRTADNPHLPQDHQEAMQRSYAGTRLGRQELDGVLFDDVEGALWSREGIDGSRVSGGRRIARESLRRVAIGVDPPASAQGDACGIVVCGLGADGVGYVLDDRSQAGLSPGGWAARVASAAEEWQADRIVAEGNNGGDMVEAVLRGAERTMPVRLVHASADKSARAEPVAALFESKQAKFAGLFPELEDELCGMTAGGGYSGPGRSPDRADAMVWAMSELMLGKPARVPRVRGFSGALAGGWS